MQLRYLSSGEDNARLRNQQNLGPVPMASDVQASLSPSPRRLGTSTPLYPAMARSFKLTTIWSLLTSLKHRAVAGEQCLRSGRAHGPQPHEPSYYGPSRDLETPLETYS